MPDIVSREADNGCPRARSHALEHLLRKDSILILLGSGGVGKTTVAAALGLAGARSGLNTAVITVDPAPRLRDALGIERLGGDPTRLDSRRLRAAGLDTSLPLAAMMLDVKGAWDAIVERFATDEAASQRILQNPFYRSLAAEFAGSEAFAALQRLYDLHQAREFDLLIVDTPPAAHAFEFLEAPARYLRLLDSRGARLFFAPSLAAGRLAARFASQTARFVVREMERFAGGRVLSTAVEFFAAAADTVDAVIDRMRKTDALLHSGAVRFALVTTAEKDRLRMARDLIDEMKRSGLKLSSVVINRFVDEKIWDRSGADALKHLEAISKLRPALANDIGNRKGERALLDYFDEYRARTLDEIERVAQFERELPTGVALDTAPEIETGMRDLSALARVASHLAIGTRALGPLETAASRIRARALNRRKTGVNL